MERLMGRNARNNKARGYNGSDLPVRAVAINRGSARQRDRLNAKAQIAQQLQEGIDEYNDYITELTGFSVGTL